MRHAKRQQMAQDAAKTQRKKTERSWALINGLAAFCVLVVLVFGGYQAIMRTLALLLVGFGVLLLYAGLQGFGATASIGMH